jgi:hypothetical protein
MPCHDLFPRACRFWNNDKPVHWEYGGHMMSPQTATVLKPEEGMFELSLLNAESSETKFDDVVLDAIERGIPPELVTRLRELWDTAKVIAGEVVAIGRIIVSHILDFLKRNPKLTWGLAVGAALTVLIGGVPLIGPLLQPLFVWVAPLYAAGVGAAMQKGDYSSSPVTAAIELANKFFELLAAIFRSVMSYWELR